MPIFIQEDNQTLNKEKYRLTQKGKETLNAAITRMEAMGLEKHDGYKMLKHLQDDEYNQGKKTDKNKVVKNPNVHTSSDKVDKPQQGILNKTVEGGIHRNKESKDKVTHAFTDWVYGNNGELSLKHKANQNRDANKATIPKIPKQPQLEKPETEKPIKTPKGEIHLMNEMFDSETDIFKIEKNENNNMEFLYDYMEEYNPRYFLECFKKNENPWLPLINPYEYQQALNYFTKGLEIPTILQKKIYQWMGIIIKNTLLFQACSELCGFESYLPYDDIFSAFLNEDEENDIEQYAIDNGINSTRETDIANAILEKHDFYEWKYNVVSDFGRQPLFNLLSYYNDNLSLEETLVIVNKALDAYHWQGDLSHIFIPGGNKTLSKITNGTLCEYKLSKKQIKNLQETIYFKIKNTKL